MWKGLKRHDCFEWDQIPADALRAKTMAAVEHDGACNVREFSLDFGTCKIFKSLNLAAQFDEVSQHNISVLFMSTLLLFSFGISP